MHFINSNFKIKKYKKPYPYVVIEDFFEENFYKKLQNNFPSQTDFKSQLNKINRMNYDTSYKDKLYNELIKKQGEYNELHNYIYSSKFIEYFISLFKDDLKSEIKKKI
tara:strand:- start:3183 stop:3506 length:324 start_codon:yes stop_codon:yes gene_type:complete